MNSLPINLSAASAPQRFSAVADALPANVLSASAVGGVPPSARAAAVARGFSGLPAFLLQASMTTSLLAGSSAPTPLYPLYRSAWGLTPITITFVFGIYALAVLVALLTLGRLSDHVGRRPVLIAAAAVQAITMMVFASADGLSDLLIARVLQGLSTGAALGAIGAGLLDLDKARGAVANAVAPMLGTALGAIGSGLLVQYAPQPEFWVYVILAVVFVAQGLGVYAMAETTARKPGALASLKPRLCIPLAARGHFFSAVPILIAVWSLAGLYGALGPTLVREMLAPHYAALAGGIALFVLAGSGALAVWVLRNHAPEWLMRRGTWTLLIGVTTTVIALATTHAPLFFVGTMIAGVGFGAGFQGAVRTVVARTAPDQRAGVLSVVFIVSYLAMGAPAIGAGEMVSHHVGVLVTACAYGLVVMLLSALALVLTRPMVLNRSA